MSKLKQTLIIILCLAVIAAGIYTLANPDIFIRYREDIDFTYTEEDGSLILTKYNGNAENLIIPSEIDEKPVRAVRGAFCNNLTLENVIVSEGIEEIDYMAFYGCASLVKIKLPDSVKTIGHAAFLGCMALERVETGSSLTEIMPFAFSDCIFLKRIALPDGLLFIGESAFSRCKRLEKLTIPESVEVIGGVTEKKGKNVSDQRGELLHTVFDGCDSLEIKIADNNPWYKIENGAIASKGN